MEKALWNANDREKKVNIDICRSFKTKLICQTAINTVKSTEKSTQSWGNVFVENALSCGAMRHLIDQTN